MEKLLKRARELAGAGLHIKSPGEVAVAKPENGTDFTLAEAQALVGGYVELVRLGDLVMLVNEEGGLHGLPLNLAASGLTQLYAGYSVVGDVLVCKAEMFN